MNLYIKIMLMMFIGFGAITLITTFIGFISKDKQLKNKTFDKILSTILNIEVILVIVLGSILLMCFIWKILELV